jgi:predicted MFS family arabinose efflux permease
MSSATLGRLRRQPGYPLFWATATVTRLADEMFSVGVVLLVLERTGSAGLAGATVAAVTLPSIVSGPLLGAWLDRTGRRRHVMVLDQLLAASTLVGIVALAGNAPNWTLPLVALLAGATWPLSFGGFTSLIPVIVPDELLAQANALEATSFNFAVIGGPALAGTISAVVDPAASLLVEAALTLAAIGLIARIPAMDAGRRAPGRSLMSIARAGLEHVAATPPLRAVTAAGALNLGGLGLLTVAFPFFALDDLGAQRSAAGYLWAAFAFGSALGAITLVRLHTRYPPQRVVLTALTGVGCLMLLWPLAASIPAALCLIALTGFVDGPNLAATFGARQRWTPPDLLGQIFTTAASLKVGAFSLGAAVAGPVVLAIHARGALLVAAAMQFVAVAVGIALGGLRKTEPSINPSSALAEDGPLYLEQDDRVDDQRDAEHHGPPVQVALDERAAPEWAGAGAADPERAREPRILARVQQHQEDQDDADQDLQD